MGLRGKIWEGLKKSVLFWLNALKCSEFVVLVIRLRHVERVERVEKRNAYGVLMWNPERKRQLGEFWRRWEDNIKWILMKYNGRAGTGLKWLRVGSGRHIWFVNCGEFVASRETSSVLRRIALGWVSQSVSQPVTHSVTVSQPVSQSVSQQVTVSHSQPASHSNQPVSKPVSHGHSVTASQSQSASQSQLDLWLCYAVGALKPRLALSAQSFFSSYFVLQKQG